MRHVRHRPARDVADEIEDKYRRYGVREFAFYEDNLLIVKDEFMALMEEIVSRGLHIRLFAPEGMEPRLVDDELMRLMSQAGFQKIHLALETIDEEISRGWNRKHARFWQFERAVEICRRVLRQRQAGGGQRLRALRHARRGPAGGGQHGALRGAVRRLGHPDAIHARARLAHVRAVQGLPAARARAGTCST